MLRTAMYFWWTRFVKDFQLPNLVGQSQGLGLWLELALTKILTHQLRRLNIVRNLVTNRVQLYNDKEIPSASTVVPALGDPRRERPPALLRPRYQCPDRHISTLNYL